MRFDHPPHRLISVAIVCAMWLAAAGLHAQQVVNPTAAALVEFTKRVTTYMDLHKKAEAAAPDVKAGASPAEVFAFEKMLAERLTAARVTAKQGDIFTADVVPVFKKIFTDYYERRSGREIRLLFDEVPDFKPQVNGIYPVNAAKANFPPRLSLALPTLTDELEYRLVGTTLVLRDTEANLVVDYIPNVLPPSARPKP